MTSRRHSLACAAALAVLILAGCASTPGSTEPTTSDAPEGSSSPAPQAEDGFEAAWLDEGRMFAVVSWGSSSCVPVVDAVSAEGQTVTVALVSTEKEDAVCTADLAPRASLGSVPEGVDPTKDVELIVTLDDGVSDDVDLDGDAALTGVPGSSTEYAPSAGWFDDESLVLLTWGSSSCPPVIESVEGGGTSGTVAFVTDEDQACTMDMAPRATIVVFGEDQVDDDGFELNLTGGGLDGTVLVRG